MYICQYFKIQELVPPETIAMHGEFGAWSQMTDQIKMTIDKIRTYYNRPVTVNTDTMKYRGLRTPACPEYKPGSQHTKGNAVDFNIEGITPYQIRMDIMNNPNLYVFNDIGGLEDFPGMTWVHIDCRPRVNGKIAVFKG